MYQKSLKIGLITFGLIVSTLIICGNTFAQRGPGGPGGGKAPAKLSASDIVSRMKQNLNLSDDQVKQITTIVKDELAQMESLMGSGSRPDHTQIESIRTEAEAKIAAVLTTEQLELWEKSKPKAPGMKHQKTDENPDNAEAAPDAGETQSILVK